MRWFIKVHPATSLALLAITFGAAPILAVSTGLLPDGASQIGAFSASLAAFVLVALESGMDGVKALARRVLIWRVGWFWWGFALFFPVFPSIAALYLFHAIGGPLPDWSALKPLWQVIPMIILLTIFAGLGEEFGWRGFLLPRLNGARAPLKASLIIGFFWGVWHIPLFVTPGTVQNEWLHDGGWLLAIGGYTLFCMAWSVQYTWIFNNTRGSVLLAAVMHGAGNAWFGGYIDVYRGHFGGILVFAAVMAAVSLVIILTTGASGGRTGENTFK